MSDKIAIQYEAVYAECAEVCAGLSEDIMALNAEYTQLREDAHGMDGRANADFNEALAMNRMKADISCTALQAMLQFLELSSRQVEEDEMILKASYTLGQSTIGGTQ